MDAKVQAVASGLKLQELMNNEFQAINGGEKTKVSLGMILLKQPDILLLDEPTNHLDIAAVEWLEGYLKEYKGTVVVISHDRAFLDETAGKILDLEGGEVTVYHTNYSGFIAQKQKKLLPMTVFSSTSFLQRHAGSISKSSSPLMGTMRGRVKKWSQ
jgi:ATPase subunit of ABC transporter with duplicated ATPase domains